MQSEGTRDGAPPVLERMYHQLPNEAEAYTAESLAGDAFDVALAGQGGDNVEDGTA